MVHVFFVRCEGLLNQGLYERLLGRVPGALREGLMRFRDRRDAQRSLLGKLLLMDGLQTLKLREYSLASLTYNAYGRPGFGPGIDFSISHSGDYAVCAISGGEPVGIDLEEIKAVPFEDFNDQFSRAEWRTIETSATPLQHFYVAWTKKEAFLKALGTGLQTPLNEITIAGTAITCQAETRYATEVPIDPNYVCHLVTRDADTVVAVQAIGVQGLAEIKDKR